ncbi:MAG: DUF1573 domain-containing protein [Chlorobi bacterium]|nr:DUF1573 domain-containing protein [Chlorobiota bacterium]
MKLQKLFMLFIAVFAFTFMGYGQVEPAEAPMFGNVRGVNSAFSHNYGTISGVAKSYNFKITNNGATTMHITDIKIPEKVGVTVLDMHIKKGQEGVIIVNIDPTIKEKGKFADRIIITTEQKEPNIVTTKEITFVVAGEVK